MISNQLAENHAQKHSSIGENYHDFQGLHEASETGGSGIPINNK